MTSRWYPRSPKVLFESGADESAIDGFAELGFTRQWPDLILVIIAR